MTEGLLKMNFSVGVNMYKEKVTCVYQYLCRGDQVEEHGSPHTGISSAEATEMWMRTWTLWFRMLPGLVLRFMFDGELFRSEDR
jgi:hypothetical protein